MEFLTEPVVLLAIILAAVAAGVVVWLMMRRPPTAPGFVNNDDYTFKGNLALYYKGTPDNPPKKSDYRKRPKNKLRVLYRQDSSPQWGSVRFDNKTNEEMTVHFDQSPFQPSGPQDIVVAANSYEERDLARDPGNGSKEYDFDVKIAKAAGGYYEFDPGVKVRRG